MLDVALSEVCQDDTIPEPGANMSRQLP